MHKLLKHYCNIIKMDSLKVHESRQIKFNDSLQTDKGMNNFDANKRRL